MNFIEGTLVNGGSNEVFFNSEKKQLNIPFSEKHSSGLNSYINKKVILGIRPENFHLQKLDESKFPKLNIQVELVEPMGNDTFIYFTLDDIQFTARVISEKDLKKSNLILISTLIERSYIYLAVIWRGKFYNFS